MRVFWAILLGAIGAQASRSVVSDQRGLALLEAPDKKEPDKAKDIKTVQHGKVPGNGYLPGSPLYEEEQARKAAKTARSAPVDAANLSPVGSWGNVPVVKDAIEGKELNFPTHPNEAYDTLKKNWDQLTGENIASVLLSSFVSVLMILCCAFVYIKNKVDPIQPPRDGLDHEAYLLDKSDWRFGLCECMQTPPICLLSCCCPAIRWADTMRMAGIMSFYTGVVVMTVLGSLSPLVGGLTSLIMLCVAVHHRQNIRRIFGMPAGNASTYCQDCCIYACCSCCAIVQEARQVEEAYAVNHPVVRLMAPPRLSGEFR